MNGRTPGFHAHLKLQLTSTPKIWLSDTANGAVETFRIPLIPSCGIRVTTRMIAISPYGTHAITGEILLSTTLFSVSVCSVSSAVADFHAASHSERAGNSNFDFGTRIPFRAVTIQMTNAISAPISDGNSGPRNIAQMIYGTQKATADIRIYGLHSSAGLMDFVLPNILHIMHIATKMIIGQMIALGIATHFVNPSFQASPLAIPDSATSPLTILNAVAAGVPTAPKGTGVLFSTSATMAAHKGGKPTLISRGAASAAGVPKPAAPSMNAPNIKPIIIN